MSMFRQFMAFLTAAAFVAHVLWGCCWHDAINCPQNDRVTCHPSSNIVGCCKHHHCADEEGQPSDAPCKLHCRGVCVYVSPQKSQLDAPQIELRLDSVTVAVLQSEDHPLAAAEFCGGANGRREAEPPARLHLLHQIFLI
jgi:hypothetical protein